MQDRGNPRDGWPTSTAYIASSHRRTGGLAIPHGGVTIADGEQSALAEQGQVERSPLGYLGLTPPSAELPFFVAGQGPVLRRQTDPHPGYNISTGSDPQPQLPATPPCGRCSPLMLGASPAGSLWSDRRVIVTREYW